MTTKITDTMIRNAKPVEITDDQIAALAREAEAHGDTACARLCYAAYDEDDARDTVARIIAANAAMAD